MVFNIAGYVWLVHKITSSSVSDKLFITALIPVVGLFTNTTFSGADPISEKMEILVVVRICARN